MEYVDAFGEVRELVVRTRYNYKMSDVSRETGLCCSDATRAQQQFAEECDINTIVKKFGITGMLPQNLRVPLNEEFVDTMDYQESLNKLMEADKAFMQMPAEIRSRFQNDPGAFVAFVSDEKNVEQCREWGLAMPKAKPAEPLSVRVIAEPDLAGTSGV